MHNYRMYIIAIGWLYVTVLLAASEPNIIIGVLSFLIYGLLPCCILLWMSGSKVRRQRRAYQELLADQRANDNNRGNTQPDK
jgi:hypothetical protein